MKLFDFYLVFCVVFDFFCVVMKEMFLVFFNSGIFWGFFKFYFCWEKKYYFKVEVGYGYGLLL